MVTKTPNPAIKPAIKPAPTDALASIAHSDDVIEYTLACVLAMAPQLSAAIVQQASAQVREVFGGDRVYISRRAGEGTSARNAQIKRDYLAGEHIPLLERRYGLKRSRLWEIIKS